MRREEEERLGRAPAATPGLPPGSHPYGPGEKRRIEFQPVAELISGPGMSFIPSYFSAKYKGNLVDAVPAGEAFDIIVKYSATSSVVPFTIVVTAVCEQNSSIRAYGKTQFLTSPGSDTMTIDDPKSIIMPNYDATFRIRKWGFPGVTFSLPPEAEW